MFIKRKKLLGRFNEKFNSNYNSFDDVKNSFSKAEEGTKISFANDEIEKINDFVSKTGRGVNDYYKAHGSNYDEMKDEEIMKEHLKVENPNLSNDEIDLYYKSTYKQDKDKYDDDEISLGKINLKKDASKARKELKGIQESTKTPKTNYVSPEEHKKMREKWLGTYKNEVDSLKGIAFEVDDKGNEFEFSLNEDDKSNLYGDNIDINNFFNRYLDGEKFNYEKYSIEMFVLNNFDRIVRSVASQNKGIGREQVIKDIKNPSFSPEKTQTSNTGKGVMEQIQDQIFGE